MIRVRSVRLGVTGAVGFTLCLCAAFVGAAQQNGRSAEIAGLSLELHARVQRASGQSGLIQVKDGGVLRSGDGVQFLLSSGRDGFVYLVARGSSGRVSVLRPFSGRSEDARIGAGERFVFPDRDIFLPLDDRTGQEMVFAIATERPIRNLTALLVRMEGAGGDPDSVTRVVAGAFPAMRRVSFKHIGRTPLVGLGLPAVPQSARARPAPPGGALPTRNGEPRQALNETGTKASNDAALAAALPWAQDDQEQVLGASGRKIAELTGRLPPVRNMVEGASPRTAESKTSSEVSVNGDAAPAWRREPAQPAQDSPAGGLTNTLKRWFGFGSSSDQAPKPVKSPDAATDRPAASGKAPEASAKTFGLPQAGEVAIQDQVAQSKAVPSSAAVASAPAQAQAQAVSPPPRSSGQGAEPVVPAQTAAAPTQGSSAVSGGDSFGEVLIIPPPSQQLRRYPVSPESLLQMEREEKAAIEGPEAANRNRQQEPEPPEPAVSNAPSNMNVDRTPPVPVPAPRATSEAPTVVVGVNSTEAVLWGAQKNQADSGSVGRTTGLTGGQGTSTDPQVPDSSSRLARVLVQGQAEGGSEATVPSSVVPEAPSSRERRLAELKQAASPGVSRNGPGTESQRSTGGLPSLSQETGPDRSTPSTRSTVPAAAGDEQALDRGERSQGSFLQDLAALFGVSQKEGADGDAKSRTPATPELRKGALPAAGTSVRPVAAGPAESGSSSGVAKDGAKETTKRALQASLAVTAEAPRSNSGGGLTALFGLVPGTRDESTVQRTVPTLPNSHVPAAQYGGDGKQQGVVDDKSNRTDLTPEQDSTSSAPENKTQPISVPKPSADASEVGRGRESGGLSALVARFELNPSSALDAKRLAGAVRPMSAAVQRPDTVTSPQGREAALAKGTVSLENRRNVSPNSGQAVSSVDRVRATVPPGGGPLDGLVPALGRPSESMVGAAPQLEVAIVPTVETDTRKDAPRAATSETATWADGEVREVLTPTEAPSENVGGLSGLFGPSGPRPAPDQPGKTTESGLQASGRATQTVSFDMIVAEPGSGFAASLGADRGIFLAPVPEQNASFRTVRKADGNTVVLVPGIRGAMPDSSVSPQLGGARLNNMSATNDRVLGGAGRKITAFLRNDGQDGAARVNSGSIRKEAVQRDSTNRETVPTARADGSHTTAAQTSSDFDEKILAAAEVHESNSVLVPGGVRRANRLASAQSTSAGSGDSDIGGGTAPMKSRVVMDQVATLDEGGMEGIAAGVVSVVTPRGRGAGLVVDAGGLVITSWQIIRGMVDANVLFDVARAPEAAAREIVTAEVTRVSRFSDLALLQLSRLPDNLTVARMGRAEGLFEGAKVHLIEHPDSGRWAVIPGTITKIQERSSWYSGAKFLHRAAIVESKLLGHPGLVGAPLFDKNLDVVGLGVLWSAERERLTSVSVSAIQAFLDDPTRIATAQLGGG